MSSHRQELSPGPLVPVADPFPRAELSFLDPIFILFFLPDLEQGHPEV